MIHAALGSREGALLWNVSEKKKKNCPTYNKLYSVFLSFRGGEVPAKGECSILYIHKIILKCTVLRIRINLVWIRFLRKHCVDSRILLLKNLKTFKLIIFKKIVLTKLNLTAKPVKFRICVTILMKKILYQTRLRQHWKLLNKANYSNI